MNTKYNILHFDNLLEYYKRKYNWLSLYHCFEFSDFLLSKSVTIRVS